MFDSQSGLRGAYSNLRGAGINGTREELTGLANRVMDAEALLQSNMSSGLRDWDLWGPLIFCLLLSLLLSIAARTEQKDTVFSGVFAMIWLGEAVVTLQIKLLGGNMYVHIQVDQGRGLPRQIAMLICKRQIFCAKRLYHWLHPISARDCRSTICPRSSLDPKNSYLHRSCGMVPRCRREHPGWKRCSQKSSCDCCIPSFYFLYGTGMLMFY